MNERRNYFLIFLLIISALLSDAYFLYGYRNGDILISSDAVNLFYLLVLSLNLLYLTSIITFNKAPSFYILSYISFYLLGAILVTRNIFSICLLLPSSILMIFSIFNMKVQNKVSKYVSMAIVLLFMLYIGKTFLFIIQPVPAPLTIENLADRIMAIGLPLPITEDYGLFLSTGYADFILSPTQFFLLLTVSSLLVENYHKIIKLLLKNKRAENDQIKSGNGLISAGYAIVATMSCQCESAIALLPAVTILLINLLLLPFFILSVTLLILTYLLITYFYERKRVPNFLKGVRYPGKRALIFIILLLVISQIAIPIAAFMNLQTSPFFLFGFGMIMILEGFVIFFIISPIFKKIKFRKGTSLFLFILSVLSSIIWFYPYFTTLAIFDPIYFSAMSYLMSLSGFVIGMVYFLSKEKYGIGLLEIYSVILGIIPIIIYYYTFSLQARIWKTWNVSEQSELSIILWIIMLPVMWIVTQKSLASPIYIYNIPQNTKE
ncbi:MAG: hypothetical protein ACP5MU_05360 [Thermoplasmata archaeon]